MNRSHCAWIAALFFSLAIFPYLPAELALADDDEKNDNQAKGDKKKDSQDLSIKYEGTGANEQILRFRVINLGDKKAPSTTAKVVTISPAPPEERTYNVQSLDDGKSFDFTYTLAAPCNGHRVKASVPVLGDDANPGNNDIEVNVCGPARQAPQGPAAGATGGVNQSGPGTQTDVNTNPLTSTIGAAQQTGQLESVAVPPVPENLRVGPHELTLPVNEWRVIKRTYRSGVFYLCDASGPPTLGTAGFAHANFDDLNDCQVNEIYETAMSFDLSELREAYGKVVLGKAILSWDDTTVIRPAENRPIVRQSDGVTSSCVNELGKPTVDWRTYDGLIPHEYAYSGPLTADWDIHGLVLDWLKDPEQESYGVLLKGFDESLDADDDNDCFSYIKNPRLRLTYTILP